MPAQPHPTTLQLRMQLRDSAGDGNGQQIAELQREVAARDAEIRKLRAQLRESGGTITDEEYRRCLEELTLLRDESIRSREHFLAAQQELADRARNAKELQDSLNDELQDVRYQLADMTVRPTQLLVKRGKDRPKGT